MIICRIEWRNKKRSWFVSERDKEFDGSMSNQVDDLLAMTADFVPTKVLEVELSQQLPIIRSYNNNPQIIYKRTMILVRLHSLPLGLITIEFGSDDISPEQLADEIWEKFGEDINQHLELDDLPRVQGLPSGGLLPNSPIKCLVERKEILQDAPLISVILATRDRAQSLAETLDSLLNSTYPQFEIVLVDNAPNSAETYDFFIQNQNRFLQNNIDIRYIREDIPGLAVAHNRGLEAARGTIVAFTDDDVVVDKHWLSEILIGFNSAPDVGCVTGLVIPKELQTRAQFLFEEFGGFTKGFEQEIYDLNSHKPESVLFPYSAGHFGTGANMAFKTDFLKKCGGFDPALGIGTPSMGADDMAAFYNMLIHGHQLVYRPAAIVFHQHRRTDEALRRQMFGYGAGLAAFLTKCMLDNPMVLFEISTRVPTGLKYLLDPASPKNKQKSRDYPRQLEWIERKGLLYGPFAYLYSRWRYRNLRKNWTIAPVNYGPSLSQHYRINTWSDEYQRNK
jgi:GT2 family glycosyltransferase